LHPHSRLPWPKDHPSNRSQFRTLVCAYVITSNLITFWQYRKRKRECGNSPQYHTIIYTQGLVGVSPLSFLSSMWSRRPKGHNWRTPHAGAQIILLLTLNWVGGISEMFVHLSGQVSSFILEGKGLRTRKISYKPSKTFLITIILQLTCRFFFRLLSTLPFISCLTHIFTAFCSPNFDIIFAILEKKAPLPSLR